MPLGNTSRPMGFIPYNAAGRWNPIVVPRPIPLTRTGSGGGNASTDMAVGDAYGIDGSGNAFRAGPSDTVRGIIMSFVLQATSLVMNGAGPVSFDYVTGTLAAVGLLIGCEDPEALFLVQADTYAASNAGGKFNLADAAPDPLWRQSRQTINIGGGAGTQFNTIDIPGGPGTAPPGVPTMGSPNNAYGANAKVLVRMLTTYNE